MLSFDKFKSHYLNSNDEEKEEIIKSFNNRKNDEISNFLINELEKTKNYEIKLAIIEYIQFTREAKASKTLIDIVERESSTSRIKTNAIEALGWMREKKAIKLLINYVCCSEIKRVYRMISYDADTPAIVFKNEATLALYRIAIEYKKEVLESILTYIETNEDLSEECNSILINLYDALK